MHLLGCSPRSHVLVRESEQAIAAVMPSLDDDERGEASALVAELRS